jgi:3-oxoacyl-(acyl-carrier-protein) synthase
VAAPGYGIDQTWKAIAANVSGLKPLSLFTSPRYGQLLVGEVQQDLTTLGAPLRGSRTDRLGWLAVREALESAGLRGQGNAERTGLSLGTSVGGSFDSERFLTALIKEGKIRARPTRFHECSSAVDLIADDFGFLGPCMTIATACSSGALAIATAAEMIQSGEADVMLAGGSDSISRMTWGGFHALLLVDAEGCRPFDANRAGMSLGEGAAFLVLEAEETARARGATIIARLSGWGASCDAYHVTAPHPDGAGALAAMQSALQRASLDAASIHYVNAHGTGTRDNDLAESKALKKLFSDRVPPVSSTKRFFGHALAASGAIEAVVCVEALRRQQIPGNPGFTTPDPAIGLAPVASLQNASLTHVMSNSFGFGGNNAVLVFSRPETNITPRQPERGPIAISAMGVIGPGTRSIRDVDPPLPPEKVAVHDCGPLADATMLNPTQRRRLSRLIQMVLIAARRSYTPDPAKRVAIAVGTGMGCLGAAGIFIENFIAKDEREPIPSQFPVSVHNAAAGQMAMDLGARGMNSAPTCGEISFESALWQGISQLAAGEADCALAGAVDELNKYVLSIGKRWGAWTEQTLPGEGAVVARLTQQDPSALAHISAVRLGRYRRPFDAEREADWIAASVDLANIGAVVSGAKGWPQLNPMYETVVSALRARAGHDLDHQTYKQHCGEYHSASAFGFSVAVELARQRKCGVLLYTLSLRGGKAVCCVQP